MNMSKLEDTLTPLMKKWVDVIDRFDDIEDERKVELSMYKIRWVFYHSILGIELFLVILLLFGIYLKL
jgi:hypothetical protein